MGLAPCHGSTCVVGGTRKRYGGSRFWGQCVWITCAITVCFRAPSRRSLYPHPRRDGTVCVPLRMCNMSTRVLTTFPRSSGVSGVLQWLSLYS